MSSRPIAPASARGAHPVRARGELRLAFARRAGATRMVEAFQSGCLRARTPNVEAQADPCVVLINTGGGVTGGDRLTQEVRWLAGARATVASQAAEKIYRSSEGAAHIDTRLEVAAEAHAEWLPQEAIIFDRAKLARTLHVELSAQSSFLGVEAVVLGRTAMGETVRDASLRDVWKIVRDGRLIYADVQRLEGPVDHLMDRAMIGNGARAMAVVVAASANAGAMLEPVRATLANAVGRAAASAWDGLLVARFLAPDGQTLKRDLLPVLATLRGGRAPPRVWSC